MIVVGITNTDRNRDLTPTHVDSFQIAPNLSVALKTSGGGEQFIAFIEKELMPYIDSAYPTLPYKILIGHSFGGLTVMNTFINHKNLFNAYVAIDPSMWWDENNLLHKAQMTLPAENYNHKTLFLGIAHTMSKGMDTATVRKDTSILTQHIRAILSLNELLQQSKRNGLSYDYKYYKHDTHSSVNLIAVYDALRFIFDSDSQITDNDMLNPSVNIIEQIEKRYKKLSEQFGFKCNAPEALINELGNEEMMLKNMDAAEQLFKMNVTNYPTGFKVYDAMGDFYTAKNDQAKAIEYYKKALAIHENADSRKKLNSLLKK
jgi:predicted alpha/beta superfamily hydrolase